MQVTITVPKDQFFGDNITRLSLMIPDNAMVLSRTHSETIDFSRKICKKLRHVGDYHCLMGTENIVLILLGRYYELKDWAYISQIIMSRRGVMTIELPDWR